MQMHICLLEQARLDAEVCAARTQISQRSLRRLLHHLAHLPGNLQPALALQQRHFNQCQVAAGRRPSQSGSHTHFILALGLHI